MDSTDVFISDFATRNSNDVLAKDSEIFIAADIAAAFINEVESRGIGILGIDGFIVGDSVYPSLSRIADFSTLLENNQANFVKQSCQAARQLLSGEWKNAPQGTKDQIHTRAAGRYMFSFALE